MEFENYEGICKYCGNIQPVMAADQHDADEKISRDCECGKYEQEKQRKLLKNRAKELFGQEAIKSGFKAMEEETLIFLYEAIDAIVEQALDSISVNANGEKVSIKAKANGKIEIERKKQMTGKFEA